jgi:protein-S-isoprenylcysteine O-methyltransferase Ste14
MVPGWFAGFRDRGGWWVLAQVPVLLGAGAIPLLEAGALPGWRQPWEIAGALVTALAGLVILAGFVHLGDALTPFPRPRTGATLREHGVYRYLRHPIYAGLIAGGLGWAIWCASLAGLLYLPVVAWFFDHKAAREERWLEQHYPGYGAYRRRVRKFVPGIY